MKGPLHIKGQVIYDRDRPVRLCGLNDTSLEPASGWTATLPKAAADQAKWGFDTVRLIFPWQSFEPTPPTMHQDTLVHHWDMDFEAALKASVLEYTSRGIGVILSPMQQHFWSDLPWVDQPTPPPGETVRGQGFPHWLYRDPPGISMNQARADFFSDTPDVDGLPAKPWDLLAQYEAHVARIFAGNELVVAIDVFNEPFSYITPASGQSLGAMYENVGRAIRAASKDVLLIFSDSQYAPSRGFAMASMPAVTGGIYGFHLYQPDLLTAAPQLSTQLGRAKAWNVPAWLGEYVGFGYMETGNAESLADHRAMLAELRNQGASWSYYAYTGTPGGLTKGGNLVPLRGSNQLGVLMAGAV